MSHKESVNTLMIQLNQWIISVELVLWEESSEWFAQNQMIIPIVWNQERVFLLEYKAACAVCIKTVLSAFCYTIYSTSWRNRLDKGKATVVNIWETVTLLGLQKVRTFPVNFEHFPNIYRKFSTSLQPYTLPKHLVKLVWMQLLV